MILPLFSFIFGTVVGSFLNVCILRLPRQQSIVSPPSHCFSCKKPIAWYDNVPLVSFILLSGRCRHCKTPISCQYPTVELISGCALFACTVKWGVSPAAGIYFLLLAALITVTFTDLETKIIPDLISLPGIICGLLLSLFTPYLSFQEALLGALVGGGSLLIIAGSYYLITRQEGMGLGDVKLLAMIGAFLGWRSILFTVMVASISGALVGIGIIVMQKKDRRYAIPFGPFLSLGAVTYLFFGQEIIRWYIHCQIMLRHLFS